MTIEWVAPASAASLVSSMVVAADPPKHRSATALASYQRAPHTSGTDKKRLILEAIAVQSLSRGLDGGFALGLR
jgi:hypothetical protein